MKSGSNSQAISSPGWFWYRQNGHLGLQFVHTLGEDQLSEQVIFDTPHRGVTCQIKFQDNLYRPRV